MATWTNVNDPKSKNVVHAHKEFSFVGLYYIDAEGTGDLIFHNPINLLSDCNPKSPFVRTVSYPPKMVTCYYGLHGCLTRLKSTTLTDTE